MTKAEIAYELVRDQVLRGGLGPGAVIPQADLARELGISTTPLREALRRLMTEGLVELDAHRDARVTRLTAEEARDLVEIRRSLDPLAAGLAAERRTTGPDRWCDPLKFTSWPRTLTLLSSAQVRVGTSRRSAPPSSG